MSEGEDEIYELRERVRELEEENAGLRVCADALGAENARRDAQLKAMVRASGAVAAKAVELAEHFEETARKTGSEAVRGLCSRAAGDLRKTARNLVMGD